MLYEVIPLVLVQAAEGGLPALFETGALMFQRKRQQIFAEADVGLVSESNPIGARRTGLDAGYEVFVVTVVIARTQVMAQALLLAAETHAEPRVVLADIVITSYSIHYTKLYDWSWKENSRKPRIVIGPGTRVEGKIRLEREVKLYISETAEVGGVRNNFV